MKCDPMFHIFRNSPIGRENLLQSISFCQNVGRMPLTVFQPTQTQCAMYFDGTVVTLDLDDTYIRHLDTSRQHLEELLNASGLRYEIFEPALFTAGTVPDIPSHWEIMACPRAVSDQISRIGLGHIGPKVRAIVKHSTFPVFIPCACYKPWTSVSVFFGGSDLGVRAIQLAMRIAERSGLPLTIFTQDTGSMLDECRAKLVGAGLGGFVDSDEWTVFRSGTLEENLYSIPYDSLVIVGAAGHSLMKELVFGSKLELIQSALPNPIVVVGPNCQQTL